MNEWQQILRRLETQVSRENYENWLEPVRFAQVDERRALHLIAPNTSARQWLEAEYSERILDAAEALGLNLSGLSVSADESGLEPRAAEPLQRQFDFSPPLARFNPRYSFDTFVVGSCNEFAHAAARAVANNPARAYNPLYVYGGVGMGKTHLIHAVGQALRKNFPSLRVVYVSSEEFMNEMIRSLRYDRMGSFHERFRAADALLVDDVHTLAKKERTQEEFFHTFNSLHNLQKQIVISSDRPPKQIPDLVDRLRNRFEWGLMADIQEPDLETKMAILDRKAEDLGVKLSDKVRLYVATRMKSNIRELEGALIRLTAIASFSKTEITETMAAQALRSILSSAERTVNIDLVIRTVAEEYDLRSTQLKERTNAQAIALPRQVAMYLTKELTGASLPAIGKAFGGKHHTTVLHALNKVEKLRLTDADFDSRLHKISQRLQTG